MYTLNINVKSIENNKYIREPMVTPKWLVGIEIEMSKLLIILVFSLNYSRIAKLRSNMLSITVYSFPLL